MIGEVWNEPGFAVIPQDCVYEYLMKGPLNPQAEFLCTIEGATWGEIKRKYALLKKHILGNEEEVKKSVYF